MSQTINTSLPPIFEKGGLDIVYLESAKHTHSNYHHLAINQQDWIAFLSQLRIHCRQTALSFTLTNQGHRAKQITLFSTLDSDIVVLDMLLVGSNKKLLPKETMLAAAKENKSLPSIKMSRRFRLPRSRFACLIGPDGVGKSTVASVIQDIVPSSVFRYKRVYRKSFLYKLFFLCQSSHKDKNSYDDGHPNIVFFSSLLRLHLKSVSSLLSKQTVLSDRYTNDNFAYELRSNNPPKESAWLRLKAKLTPAPHTIIQLDAPTPVISARRDELSPTTIDFLSDFYLKSTIQIQPDHYIYLNTDIPLKQTKTLLERLLNTSDTENVH